MSGRPSPELEAHELPGLVELHRRLGAAYSGDRAAGLDLIAAGEISVVVRWEEAGRAWAVRPLPPFLSPEAFDSYHTLFREYLHQLHELGIPLVPSGLLSVWAVAPEGAHTSRSYCAQPLLPAGSIGPAFLRDASPAAAQAFLAAVVTHIQRAVGPRCGLDAQASNWVMLDGEVHYLDVSTPMLRDERGRDRIDAALFLAALPAALRPLTRVMVVPGMLATYHDPRRVMLDFAGNLIREGLETFVAPWLERANPGLERPIDASEVRRYIRLDRVMWSSLQLLRRLDRAYRRLRREPYPFLLP